MAARETVWGDRLSKDVSEIFALDIAWRLSKQQTNKTCKECEDLARITELRTIRSCVEYNLPLPKAVFKEEQQGLRV